MEPTNLIVRNINIIFIWRNAPNSKAIFLKNLFISKRKYFIYSYITFLGFIFCVPLYSQEPFVETHGTLVICLSREDTVWIGVDSKTITTNGIDIGQPTCKIAITPNFVFASAGVYQVIDTSSGKPMVKFNIYNVLAGCVRRTKTMDKCILVFNKIVSDYLGKREIINIEKYKVGDIIEDAVLQCIFVYYEKNHVVIIHVKFITKIIRKTKSGVDVGVDVTINPMNRKMGDGITNPIIFQPPGINITDINIFIDQDMVDNLREIMSDIIKTHKNVIGFPINIVRIDKSGFHWIDKHQPCE